ncbi:alcohol dehydrogenase family protein [Hoeflea sp. TYP-13]|uniref:alcohol dehydrogenase family protein n=1 Tax=Hoeflea sp. TYP-13 TaxID=3230023 RepID=UPI0034C5B6BD
MTEIPQTMRAMVLTGHGEMDKLEYRTDWPVPQADPGEVLIKVHACGLNNTDVNTRTGWYSKTVSDATTGSAHETVGADDPSWGGAPIRFPRIQGGDAVGTVVAVGEGADISLIGRRVMIEPWIRDPGDPLNMNKYGYFGSECDGGFAEYTKVVERNVCPVECDLDDAELATFATSWITAENMLNRANVTNGDSVLIPGASGGVGSALVQLANRRGATTVAMATRSKHDEVAALGPDAVVDRSPDNLKAELKRTIGSETVSVVADVVGGAYWPMMIDALARGGRYTCAGAIAGPIVELDLRTFYLRDLTFTGATAVPPGTFGNLVRYIEDHEVRPVLAGTYPLERLHDAQRAFIDKKHIGNIVVTME